MSIKTVVLSIKHGAKVVSWEGEQTPACEFRALEPSFWEAPEASELFTTRKKTLDHPVLGRLTRVAVQPGSKGWIGIDVDRRWVIDVQGMQGLNEWLGEVQMHLVFRVPRALREACETGEWVYCVPGTAVSQDVPGPRIYDRTGWDAFGHHLKDLVSARGGSSRDVRITAPFQRGWRWVNAETLWDPLIQNRRVGWVMGRLLKTDWAPHLLPQRPLWEEFLEDYYKVTPSMRRGWESRQRERALDQALPPVAPRLARVPRF